MAEGPAVHDKRAGIMKSRKVARPLKAKGLRLDRADIRDPFWSGYQGLVRERVLPYQWEALNDRIPGAEKSHCIANLKIAAGLGRGAFKGFIFQDSDLYKWLETVGLCLAAKPDPEMEKKADKVIDLLAL